MQWPRDQLEDLKFVAGELIRSGSYQGQGQV